MVRKYTLISEPSPLVFLPMKLAQAAYDPFHIILLKQADSSDSARARIKARFGVLQSYPA